MPRQPESSRPPAHRQIANAGTELTHTSQLDIHKVLRLANPIVYDLVYSKRKCKRILSWHANETTRVYHMWRIWRASAHFAVLPV